jgi:hypothetical protein
VGLAAISNLIVLNVGLAVRSCNKNIIIKKKKTKKKINMNKKASEEKDKKKI